MKPLYPIFYLCFFFSTLCHGQQTVGLFIKEPGAFEGYTLIAPTSSQRTLLIDNCGRLVHSWSSETAPGLSAYLLENGNLLRTGRSSSAQFGAGGQGGIVEIYNWEGQLTWQYNYANLNVLQHHDVAYLPNGNVLILAWERNTREDAIALGRDSLMTNNEFWFEHIVEVKPISLFEGEIVWRWNTKDHLIQDRDSTLDNYGIPSEHPEKMDINYAPQGFTQGARGPDWVHANAIDYNAELDQILITSRHLGEIWVIDHSTTTAEAATGQGGRYGKGGDILYRWGNPETYGRGTSEDKQLFGPHDANWIPADYPGGGQIMIFNNGVGQPGTDLSSVLAIQPPIDTSGNYLLDNDTTAFGPIAPTYFYDGSPDREFFARNISGAQRLPNGNTLICNGPLGNYFEVNDVDKVVWDYINPLSRNEPVEQGDSRGVNSTFRVYRYGVDYPAFDNKTLIPGDRLEINPLPLPADCLLTSTSSELEQSPFTVQPNPFNNYIQINCDQASKHTIQIFDLSGKIIAHETFFGNRFEFSTQHLNNGFYLLQIDDQAPRKIVKVF